MGEVEGLDHYWQARVVEFLDTSQTNGTINHD